MGLNKFEGKEEAAIPVFKINDSIRDQQSKKLALLKNRRDTAVVKTCLEKIRRCAVEGGNIMPAVVDGVEAYCTLGEIADVLRSVYGEYKQ